MYQVLVECGDVLGQVVDRIKELASVQTNETLPDVLLRYDTRLQAATPLLQMLSCLPSGSYNLPLESIDLVASIRPLSERITMQSAHGEVRAERVSRVRFDLLGGGYVHSLSRTQTQF